MGCLCARLPFLARRSAVATSADCDPGPLRAQLDPHQALGLRVAPGLAEERLALHRHALGREPIAKGRERGVDLVPAALLALDLQTPLAPALARQELHVPVRPRRRAATREREHVEPALAV